MRVCVSACVCAAVYNFSIQYVPHFRSRQISKILKLTSRFRVELSKSDRQRMRSVLGLWQERKARETESASERGKAWCKGETD